MESTLDHKQLYAYNAMKAGKNVFLTAPAGTGKTYVLNCFINFCQNDMSNVRLGITSTTGVSALLLGGSTLHSFLGIGLGDGSVDDLLRSIINRKKTDIWESLRTLIIDEISMMSPVLFEKLNELAQIIREDYSPFGGIQIILVGDLLQLPVIKEKKFVFDAPCWKSLNIEVIQLQKNYRQDDILFREVLNKIRVGNIDEQVRAVLKQRINIKIPTEIKPTRIFCIKRKVQEVNEAELDKLRASGKVFHTFTGKLAQKQNSKKDYTAAMFRRISENFLNNLTTPRVLQICEDAQVMLTVNISVESGLVNGSRGIVTGFDQNNFPTVQFLNEREITLTPNTWDIKDNGKVTGTFSQIPLKIAYASTVHSCQGSTMDFIEIDLQNTFEYGQIYTALSRVQTLEGLFIRNLDFRKIQAHPKALEFYEKNKDFEEEDPIDILLGELEI